MRRGRSTTVRLPVAAGIASRRPDSAARRPRPLPHGRRWALLALAPAAPVLLALWFGTSSGLAQAQTAPSLSTDRAAYAAGDAVEIAGTGFAPFEVVTLTVTHDDGTAEADRGHEPWVTSADDKGLVTATWRIEADDSFGRRFIVRAAGAQSGPSRSAAFVRSAVVATDAATYVAGDTVRITGRDFSPGEVTLQVTHDGGADEPAMDHEPQTVTVQEDGTFAADWSPHPTDLEGPDFVVTATGDPADDAVPAHFSRVAVVATDKGAYQPGDTAVITGRGFAPSEWVELQVAHVDGQTDGNGHEPFDVLADPAGNVTATWYVDPDHSAGSYFRLTALGETSGVAGDATFSDLDGGSSSVSLTTLGSAYAQDFNTLAATGALNNLAINGWYLSETGSSGNNNGQYQAGTGSGNAGDTYSFGAAANTERAFGGLLSGTLNPTIGAQLTNNTGSTITSLDVSYVGEMWRAGVANRNAADRLDFQLSTNATSLTTGTWVDYNGLDFNSPNLLAAVGALNGNAPGNQAAVGFSITGLSIPNGASFWIRWNDFDIAPGADDGLAVDNFSITPNGVVPPPTLTINDVSATEGNGGTTTFTFTVSLSSPAGAGGVSFDIATSDTTATSPSDYTARSLTGQTIPAGSSTYSFSVLVNGDLANEAEETFLVNVTNVTGAVVGDAQGNGRILNDDVVDVCSDYTPIHAIQGSGAAAAISGTVATKGVVVGDFEGTAAASGFYIQDLTGDGDAATSDGLFVFSGSANLVSVGQVVRVTGFARERFNQTTINGSNSNTAAVTAANIVQCGTGSVTPTDVTLPFANADVPERYEGMLVRFPQPLVIAEYFNYDRFGEIVLAQPLAGEPRPFSGTALDEPGAPANARTAANALRRITLDDVQSAQNPPTLRHPNGLPFSLGNRFRGGDTVANALGVLAYDFNLYRIFPTGPADYTAANPRPAAPEPVGGTIRVAAMNTLNFFVTADYPAGDPLDNKCGPANNVECRGWDSDQVNEFTRQRDKLLTALAGLDGDVIGLNELENSTGVEPLASITAGLPGYAYIETGTIGTDAIKVGLIYRPAAVTPVGAFKVLTSAVDPRFIDTKSRPSLAQTFEVNATGARFTVAVNHLKSKGSDCNDVGDPDLLDGQGNCSQTRRAAAEALVDWLATDPTGSGDPDFLIMGDLNSYAREDAIGEIAAGSDDTVGTGDDFTNLIHRFHGDFAYSYTFDGQAGYLDHALANTSLLGQVTGAAEWHINSDEPDVLDYDTSFKPPAQDALYEVNPYRTSDHDAVVVGLAPNAPPTVAAGGPYAVPEGGSTMLAASGSDPNGDSLTYAWDLDGNGSFETGGQSVSFDAALLDGPSSSTVQVRATDPGGSSAVSSATVLVTNVAPTVGASFGAGSLGCGPDNATLTVTWSDPAAADTHSAVINWGDGTTQTVSTAASPLVLSHTYAAAGNYTATVGVSDDDGGTGNATASVLVKLNSSGFLPPINADGTSVFKSNSTIPVKIRFTNCDGSTPADLAPTIKLTMISGATPGLQINEPISTSAADTTGVMRFSSSQYIYNLATKPLPDASATYLITVTIPSSGQTFTVQFGLRP
jgi:uncharacterized protein